MNANHAYRPTQCPRLLTASQMARRIRVQLRWLKAEAEAGRVPALDVGNTFLFAPEAVEDALLKRAAAHEAHVAHVAHEEARENE